MKNIKYYEDLMSCNLLAHEDATEFFVRYIPESQQWQDCNISFSIFKHNYYYNEISREEVIQRTAGNLPEEKFKEYQSILFENRGGPINE